MSRMTHRGHRFQLFHTYVWRIGHYVAVLEYQFTIR